MAGTVTTAQSQALFGHGVQYRVLTLTCTADSADGSFPDTTLRSLTGRLVRLVTNPGATAPTTGYDITIEDGQAADLLAGHGANRSATVTETEWIYGGSLGMPVYCHGDYTFKIAGNSVNSAVIVAELHYLHGAV